MESYPYFTPQLENPQALQCLRVEKGAIYV